MEYLRNFKELKKAINEELKKHLKVNKNYKIIIELEKIENEKNAQFLFYSGYKIIIKLINLKENDEVFHEIYFFTFNHFKKDYFKNRFTIRKTTLKNNIKNIIEELKRDKDFEKALNKNKYLIMQGILSESGSGDMYPVAEAATLKEAKKNFNEVKKDVSGWAHKKGDRLVTHIEPIEQDESDFKIIEYYEIKF